MIPKYQPITDLEILAASDSPCDSGAWWIMLQTAQSVVNSTIEYFRDPVNNKELDQFWDDLYSESSLNQFMDIPGERPLPYDDLMQLISYCGNQLIEVIDNPRHKIVKADKMVTPNRLRVSSQKTMNWLGKQPGRTIREKVAGKNKILTQANVYSYDVKENQVALSLYRDLYKKSKPRLENIESYSLEYESPNLRKLKRIKKGLRESELQDVKAIKHSSPNNVLLSDKTYAVIWKAFLDVCKYDKELIVDWEKAKILYVKALFLCVVSGLLKYEDFIVLDERNNIKKNDALEIKMIVGLRWNNPMIVEFLSIEDRLSLSICDYYSDKKEYGARNEYELVFLDYEEPKYLARRGYPFIVSINEGEENIELFADKGGIEIIRNWIESKIQQLYGEDISVKQRTRDNKRGTIIYDLLSDGKECIISGYDDVTYDLSEKAVHYADAVYGERCFKQSQYSVYKNADGSGFIHDAISLEAETHALDYSLKRIRDEVIIDSGDYFIYLIPDSLEELLQKKIKQSVSTWFPREKTFPIWRSVAAATNLIYIKEYDIRNGEYLLSIDLMDESATAGLISLTADKKLKGLICNHFPPFSQCDEGDDITEAAFYRDYLRKVLEMRGDTLSDEQINEIVASGIVRTVIEEKSYRNYICADLVPEIVRIEYEPDLLSSCIRNYVVKIKNYMRALARMLPDKEIVHVNILSDSLINMLTDEEYDQLISIIKQHVARGVQCVYLSACNSVQSGAMVYKDRLNHRLPTWTEYLPELSLEVIKDGRYAQLQLIDDSVSFDVMGEDNEHIVEESLVLKAGENEFRFPLLKKDISRKATMIEAYVTDKSFPLEYDVVVALTVKYKYGYDNSYELTLRPEDENEKAFAEIVVEWTNVKKEENIANIWPPDIKPQDADAVLKAIEVAKSSLQQSESRINNQFVLYRGSYDLRPAIKQVYRFLNQNIFKIRNIVMSGSYEAEEFITWFVESELYIYLGEIGGLFKKSKIPESFYIMNKGEELSFFEGDCLQLMFSLGKYTPKELQNYYIKSYKKKNPKYRMKVMIDMLLKNESNTEAIALIIEDIRDAQNPDTYNMRMDGLIRELGRMCCFDPELIFAFYSVDAEFVKELAAFVEHGLNRLLNRCLQYDGNYRVNNEDKKRYIADKKRYVAYVETLLALLRLRNPDRCQDFDMLVVGSEESRKLSNVIKQLDDYMGNPKSGVRLKLNKPAALTKMSDLSYALDLYLNGDRQAAYIEVVGAEDVD